MTLPITTFPTLWHVGTLDPADKKRGSYEGPCLSVSRHQAAWREISDGFVSGPCWKADGSGIRMLNALSLDTNQKETILAWGVERGYAERATLWRITRFDDELDEEVSSTFESRDDAVLELDLDEDDEDRIAESIEEVDEHRSTPLLLEEVLDDRTLTGDRSVLDALLPLWVERETDLHGVWWQERHDPLAYSAPRGGIVPSRVDLTIFLPTDVEPWEDADHEDGE
jgi:hypothetical protein